MGTGALGNSTDALAILRGALGSFTALGYRQILELAPTGVRAAFLEPTVFPFLDLPFPNLPICQQPNLPPLPRYPCSSAMRRCSACGAAANGRLRCSCTQGLSRTHLSPEATTHWRQRNWTASSSSAPYSAPAASHALPPALHLTGSTSESSSVPGRPVTCTPFRPR